MTENVLVVKVNAHIKSKDLKAIEKHIRDSMKTGLVVLPSYCEAQVVPKDIEVRMEDMFTEKGEKHECP